MYFNICSRITVSLKLGVQLDVLLNLALFPMHYQEPLPDLAFFSDIIAASLLGKIKTAIEHYSCYSYLCWSYCYISNVPLNSSEILIELESYAYDCVYFTHFPSCFQSQDNL